MDDKAGVSAQHSTFEYGQSPDEENSGHARHSRGHDEADMNRIGVKQELRRNFHSISTFSLTCIVMGTWMGMIASSSFSLINGGRAGTVWIYIITWIFQTPVIASMAEMASMAPTSAGQYHWVSEFAPPSMQNFLSYISGWLSALGWNSNIAVTAYVAANIILALVSLANPSYTPQPWQQTVMMIGLVAVAILFNAFGARMLPSFEGGLLIFDIIGFFAVLIPLWVLAPKISAHDIFASFFNGGEWSSTGAAVIVGILAPAGAFIGADSAAHLSEEVANASLTVPRVMFATVLINGALGLVAIVSYVACIQDVEEQILNSTIAFPFMEVFQTATGSTAGAIGMSVPFVVLAFSMTLNSVAAASRQAWSFGRDGGLPFSPWFHKVHVIFGQPLPVNAMFSTLIMTVVLGLINLGSAEAFNSINGLISGAIALTYGLSIGCVLWRRLFGQPLPYARWSLGRFGLLTNGTGFLFEMFVMVMSFFPLFSTVTTKTMNWGIAMFGGASIICAIYYVVKGRHVYVGPVARVKRE
ncbi:hypothetical protein LTR97_004824 [Elasticomyces elasticus]|uniref:Uncharacterized protein n=1 Tax=Elasticomyces elasticus TaxID=574655 RepID=A0AAN7W7C7_9PEZI|nr:hypothetical protein LTR97_004824 [Elasticomyces elasticus]